MKQVNRMNMKKKPHDCLVCWLVSLAETNSLSISIKIIFLYNGDRNIACMMLITWIVTIVSNIKKMTIFLFIYFVNWWLWWGVEQFFCFVLLRLCKSLYEWIKIVIQFGMTFFIHSNMIYRTQWMIIVRLLIYQWRW